MSCCCIDLYSISVAMNLIGYVHRMRAGTIPPDINFHE